MSDINIGPRFHICASLKITFLLFRNKFMFPSSVKQDVFLWEVKGASWAS